MMLVNLHTHYAERNFGDKAELHRDQSDAALRLKFLKNFKIPIYFYQFQ